MHSRDSQVQVIVGAALLLLAAALALSLVLQQHRRGQPPEPLRVDVAVERVLAGETLDNVRLIDLTDTCGASIVHRGRHYDRAVRHRGHDGPHLLFELPMDEECTDDTPHQIEVVGSLVDPRRTWLDLDALDHPNAILHMHRIDRYELATLVLSLLLGAYLLYSGLRLRRDPDA